MRNFLYWQIRLALRPFLSPRVPLALQRFWGKLAAASTKGPPGFKTEAIAMDGVPGLHLSPLTARPGRALLYLHGGAYVIGGPGSHAKLAAQLGHAAGCETYFPDYRLAPEHPFPAALDDAIAAYRWLLAQKIAPDRIVLAGDSAGGGLALATALALRDRQLPLPSCLVLLSPFTDLTLSGESHTTRAARDPMLGAPWLRFGGAAYAGTRALDDPLLSPLFADLRELPRMLIQVGSEEILLSDSERLAQRAQAAGVRATLNVFEGMWHDFQVHAGMLPDSDRALAQVAEFVGA